MLLYCCTFFISRRIRCVIYCAYKNELIKIICGFYWISRKSLGLPFHPSLCLLLFASSKTVVMAVLDTLKYVQNQVLFVNKASCTCNNKLYYKTHIKIDKESDQILSFY